MKKRKITTRGSDKRVVAFLCVAFLSSGSLMRLMAAANWAQWPGQAEGVDSSASGAHFRTDAPEAREMGTPSVESRPVLEDWPAVEEEARAENVDAPPSAQSETPLDRESVRQLPEENETPLSSDLSMANTGLQDPYLAAVSDTETDGTRVPSGQEGDTQVTGGSATGGNATASGSEPPVKQGTTPPPDRAPAIAPGTGPLPGDLEPAFPTSPETQGIANAVPLSENPDLQLAEPFSEYDLARVETPLFLTEAINDFAERPLYLMDNWSVKPHLSIGTFYDGNIFVRSNNTESDFITRVAPGITMRLGQTDSIFYVVADYTAGFNLYMTHFKESTIDQDATASFQWALPKTTIGLHLGVSSDTGTDIDATNRVRHQLYFAGLTTHYDYGDKTSLDLNGDYSRSDFPGLVSSSQVDAAAFLNYAYSPKTQIGAGGSAGYVFVGGGNQHYEEPDLRVTYRATGKLTLSAEGGAQFRQFEGGGSSSVTPVFSIAGAWNIRYGTELDLSFQRQIFVSAILRDQDYTASTSTLSVVQRITDNVSASLSFAYINSDYNATTHNVDATRQDNYISIRPAVQWRIASWVSVGIFYEYSQNFSHGQGADSFRRDRGGVDFAFLF